MGFDSFRANIVIRVLAMLGNLSILAWGYINTDWQITPILCLVILCLQLVDLVHFVEMTNRQFTSFLHSITEGDYSTHVNNDQKGESFQELALAYNQITSKFALINTERAANHQLMESLIEHISTALLCIDEQGKIILMNRSAKDLFHFPYIQNAYALNKVDPELPSLVLNAPVGESQLIKLKLEGEDHSLAMFTTKFNLLENKYTLVSFQNIRDELESRELDSWQKLIRVLTHEIMNSVTPIVSLTSVIKQTLVDDSGKISSDTLTSVETEDLLRSLIAIEARGQGLVRFVQSYNNLANPPKPYFTNVEIPKLLERVSLLMLPDLEQAGISLQTRCVPSNLFISADAQQIEQVLINLVKNSREALIEKQCSSGRIQISAIQHPSKGILIVVSDNGPGIDEEKLQDVFIPFYTSKRQGSGIGLSISRQLMLANKGQLAVSSLVGKGTEFTLSFRNSKPR